MIRLVIVSILLLVASCKQDTSQIKDAIAKVETLQPQDAVKKVDTPREAYPSEKGVSEYKLCHEPDYELMVDMNTLENGDFDLVISMFLKNGAHYVSPNAVRDFSGKFTVKLHSDEKVKAISDLVETPPSVEEYDPHPFVRGTVNWVRVNTKYNQTYRPLVDEKFFVGGTIQFTIEPKCTLEQVPFFIKYEDGHMWAEIDRC